MEMPSLLKNELVALQKEAGTITKAQELLALCKIFTNKVQIAQTEQVYYGNVKYSSKKIGAGKKVKKEELMIYGARLSYALRSFFLDEEIIFHIATRTNGSYGADAFIPQSEIMQNLHRVGKQNAIGLTHAIEKMLVNDENAERSDVSFVNKWKMVEQLADTRNVYNKDRGEDIRTKTGKAILAYQKTKADFNVYIAFSGNKAQKYYNLQGDFVGFNNGWLWEWYDTIYNSDDSTRINQVNASIDAGSIQPLFEQGFDRIPGIKQGDYMDKFGRQVQNKYDNLRIITYNNILKILYELTPALEAYVANSSDEQAAENLLTVLRDNFIPESAAAMARSADEDLDIQILNKLNNIVIKT